MDYFIWDIDPLFISFGFIKIRWYGLMFATAFILGYLLMNWIYKREGKNVEEVDDLLWYVAIGGIVGARLGHCLFYAPEYYFSQPLKILAIWEGGLASHGGIAGIIIGLFLYQRRVQHSYAWLLDRVAVVCALGAIFVRTGNFFNSEIVGIPTNVPWAIVFKRIDSLPRHPVQIYEAIAYAFIFLLLFTMYKKIVDKVRPGVIFATSLVAIFTARFFLEFVKTKQADYANDFWMSTGQMLSIPFFFAGLSYIVFSFFKKRR
jgi:prolipoprotein diacylglyceryl transferase